MIRAIVFDYFGVLSDPDEKTYETLRALKDKGYILGILSNASQEHIEDVLKSARIYELFHSIQTSSFFGFAKPDKRSFEAILRSLGTSPEETLFIDDTGGHLKTARDLGCVTHLFSSWRGLYEHLQRVDIL